MLRQSWPHCVRCSEALLACCCHPKRNTCERNTLCTSHFPIHALISSTAHGGSRMQHISFFVCLLSKKGVSWSHQLASVDCAMADHFTCPTEYTSDSVHTWSGCWTNIHVLLRNGREPGCLVEHTSPAGYEPDVHIKDLNNDQFASAQGDSGKRFASVISSSTCSGTVCVAGFHWTFQALTTSLADGFVIPCRRHTNTFAFTVEMRQVSNACGREHGQARCVARTCKSPPRLRVPHAFNSELN